jgi:hypothetical protein
VKAGEASGGLRAKRDGLESIASLSADTGNLAELMGGAEAKSVWHHGSG